MTIKAIAKWITISLICLLFSEFVLYLYGIEPIFLLVGKDVAGGRGSAVFRLDPQLLYQLKGSASLGLNSAGFRNAEFGPKTTERRIVVLGDSFPMGLAVDAHETFPKQLEKRLMKTSVLNLGVAGYGPDQALGVLKRYALALAPDTVILTLYPPNDFMDLVKNKIYRIKGDVIVENYPNPVEEILPPFRLPIALRLIATGRYLPQSDEARLEEILFADKDLMELQSQEDIELSTQLLRHVLQEFKRELYQRKIRFVVVILPSYTEIQGEQRGKAAFNTERRAREVSLSEGILTLDLTEDFVAWQGAPLYLDDDRHLNQTGHAFVAQLLANRLSE